jgi:hypothetical protein
MIGHLIKKVKNEIYIPKLFIDGTNILHYYFPISLRFRQNNKYMTLRNIKLSDGMEIWNDLCIFYNKNMMISIDNDSNRYYNF